LNHTYKIRRNYVFRLLDKLNCTYQSGQSGLFVWAQAPMRDVDDLIDDLLVNKHIFITPGHIFGAKGRRYLRVSLCSPEEIFKQAILRL